MRKTNEKYTTNNQIVEKLYRDKYFKYITKSFKLTDDDKDDLMSIIMLQLLEMNTDKLIDLYERDKLLSYVKSMCCIQYYSKVTSSQFYKDIRRFKENSVDINVNDIEKCEDDKIDNDYDYENNNE